MPFTIVRNDITRVRVDAVVNAANTDLAMGGGVCGAIFKAAGARELSAACDKLAPIKTGELTYTEIARYRLTGIRTKDRSVQQPVMMAHKNGAMYRAVALSIS